MENKSIWEKYYDDSYQFNPLQEDKKVKVLIVGGGIVGLLCAYELKKRNIEYILVEKDMVGSKTSKNTTAFLTVNHDILYHQLIKKIGLKKAQEYYELNNEAIDEYEKLSKEYDIDFKRCDSIIYSFNNLDKIIKEKEALDILNIKNDYINKMELDVRFSKAIKIYNQATINPIKLINALKQQLNIYENTQIVKIKKGIAYSKNNNKIHFSYIILATRYPIKNIESLYFLKLTQNKSYVAAIKDHKISNTYTNIDENGYYFRGYKNYLIIGGYDSQIAKSCLCDFIDKINEDFIDKEIEYIWQGQDCVSLDNIPYIGEYGIFKTNYLVATGFNMWGFTWAMIASKTLADLIEKKGAPLLLNPSRNIFKKKLFKNISCSIKNIISFKTPRCSHMKANLIYNPQEKKYECPVHGSSFTSLGKVIESPAKKDINIK